MKFENLTQGTRFTELGNDYYIYTVFRIDNTIRDKGFGDVYKNAVCQVTTKTGRLVEKSELVPFVFDESNHTFINTGYKEAKA